MTAVNSKRSEERVKTALKVDLGEAIGITRDVSVSGVFFQTNLDCTPGEPGSEISFSIELDSPAGKLTLKCAGQIVRVEHQDDGLIGVAAKIVTSKLELAN